jgi:hypothetical protein
MKITAEVTGGKHIAVRLLVISGVSTVNPLVDIHGRKGEIFLFYSVPDTRQNKTTVKA